MKLSERLAQLFSKEDRLTPHVIYAQLTEAAAIEIVAEAQRLEEAERKLAIVFARSTDERLVG